MVFLAMSHCPSRIDAAIRLERGCNELVRIHEVDLLCVYIGKILRSLPKEPPQLSISEEEAANSYANPSRHVLLVVDWPNS
jgi:hypothetical protein